MRRDPPWQYCVRGRPMFLVDEMCWMSLDPGDAATFDYCTWLLSMRHSKFERVNRPINPVRAAGWTRPPGAKPGEFWPKSAGTVRSNRQKVIARLCAFGTVCD